MRFLIYLIVFIPVFIWPMPFGYVTSKSIAFRIIVILLALPTLFVIIKKRIYPPIIISLFMFISLLTSYTGVHFKRSFYSDLRRCNGWVELLYMFVMMMAIMCFCKYKHAKRLATLSLLVSTIVSLDVIIPTVYYNITVDSRNAFSSFGNIIYIAQYIMIHLFLLLHAIPARKILVFPLVVHVAALSIIQVRATILGALLGILYILYKKMFFKKFMVVVSLFVGLLSYLVYSGSISTQTLGYRLELWKIALLGFVNRPILGFGMESYRFVYKAYNTGALDFLGKTGDKAHNVFLGWLIDGGLIGFSAYCILLAYIFTKIKNDTVLTALFIAYCFQNFFFFDVLTTYLYFFMMMGIINIRAGEPALSDSIKILLDTQKTKSPNHL